MTSFAWLLDTLDAAGLWPTLPAAERAAPTRRLWSCEDPWTDCALKPAAEVDRLLGAAGGDRLLGLRRPGGNDGFAVLGPRTCCAGPQPRAATAPSPPPSPARRRGEHGGGA